MGNIGQTAERRPHFRRPHTQCCYAAHRYIHINMYSWEFYSFVFVRFSHKPLQVHAHLLFVVWQWHNKQTIDAVHAFMFAHEEWPGIVCGYIRFFFCVIHSFPVKASRLTRGRFLWAHISYVICQEGSGTRFIAIVTRLIDITRCCAQSVRRRRRRLGVKTLPNKQLCVWCTLCETSGRCVHHIYRVSNHNHL